MKFVGQLQVLMRNERETKASMEALAGARNDSASGDMPTRAEPDSPLSPLTPSSPGKSDRRSFDEPPQRPSTLAPWTPKLAEHAALYAASAARAARRRLRVAPSSRGG